VKYATAGTMESNDCLITVKPHQTVQIVIESIVINQFGQAIEKVIRETLKEANILNIHVHIQDKGALDYTIKARLLTALSRLEKS
jgi:citrate lyase subunit gamma (acyl carrier protein)